MATNFTRWSPRNCRRSAIPAAADPDSAEGDRVEHRVIADDHGAELARSGGRDLRRSGSRGRRRDARLGEGFAEAPSSDAFSFRHNSSLPDKTILYSLNLTLWRVGNNRTFSVGFGSGRNSVRQRLGGCSGSRAVTTGRRSTLLLPARVNEGQVLAQELVENGGVVVNDGVLTRKPISRLHRPAPSGARRGRCAGR